MGLAKEYQHTKFEVSSFTRFKFMEGVLKFKNSASALSSIRWVMPRFIHVPNLKFLALPVPKTLRRCRAMAGCVRLCAQTPN